MCKEGTFGASLHVVVVLFVAAVYTWSTLLGSIMSMVVGTGKANP